jgi:SAM-dependent methyltransferase
VRSEPPCFIADKTSAEFGVAKRNSGKVYFCQNEQAEEGFSPISPLLPFFSYAESLIFMNICPWGLVCYTLLVNILRKMFNPKCNVAWKSNKPTQFVIDCFEKGLIKKDNSVIDIGCGFGRNSNWLASKEIDVTAVNIDKDELASAKKEAARLGIAPNYINVDFLFLDLAGKLFDVALDLGCSHMLSRQNQLLFTNKVAELIKPGGYLIYFGFSKKHPDYDPDNKRAIYRDVDDLVPIYGKYFDIFSSSECSWRPKPEEHSKYPEHIGLNIVWRRKFPF